MKKFVYKYRLKQLFQITKCTEFSHFHILKILLQDIVCLEINSNSISFDNTSSLNKGVTLQTELIFQQISKLP